MKKKLKLSNLNIESFVTSLDDTEKQTIKGQGGSWLISDCFFSAFCPTKPATIIIDESGTWTKAPRQLQICQSDTPAGLSALGECPACVKRHVAIVNEQ